MWIKAAWNFLTSNLAIAGGAVLSIFYGVIKYQSAKIEDLEHENKVKGKLEDIRESQDAFIEKVSEDEAKQIDKTVKSKPISDDDSFIDGM